jgi:hypothetical protein
VRAAGLSAGIVEDEDLEARAVIGRRSQLPGVTGLR